jgi:hypothetical protein
MRRRLWLCLPPLLVCLADQAITLLSQPCEYWLGDYSAAREGSPHGLWLMNQHPLAYLTAVAGYMFAFTAGIVLLPRGLARVAALALVLGHSWGMATWLWQDEWADPDSAYPTTLLLFVVIAVVTATCMDWSDGRRPATQPWGAPSPCGGAEESPA